MRTAHRWIVCLALAGLAGFILGTHVEMRVARGERSSVVRASSDSSASSSPTLHSSVGDSALDHKSAALLAESVAPSTSSSAQATALAESTFRSTEATRKSLFPSPSTQSLHPVEEVGKLHSAYRVSCQFDPGYSAFVTGDSFTLGGANWQGGLIGYDVIDEETGRTTMSGSAGATGSSTGTAEMQRIKTNAGVSFSGVMPNGDLIVTTIFSERNTRGAFLAVMSSHATTTGHSAQQFYGACDVY